MVEKEVCRKECPLVLCTLAGLCSLAGFCCWAGLCGLAGLCSLAGLCGLAGVCCWAVLCACFSMEIGAVMTPITPSGESAIEDDTGLGRSCK